MEEGVFRRRKGLRRWCTGEGMRAQRRWDDGEDAICEKGERWRREG